MMIFFANIDMEAIAMDFVQSNSLIFIPGALSSATPTFTLPKSTREGRTNKIDYWSTKWGQMLLDPLINLASSKIGKLFRRRFRLATVSFVF